MYESERFQYNLTLKQCYILLIYNGMIDKACFLIIILRVQYFQFHPRVFQICADNDVRIRIET